MAIKFFNKNKNQEMTIQEYIDFLTLSGSKKIQIKELAISHAIDLIAKTVSKCEFETYKNGKPVKDNLYYYLNVKPNINECATSFIYNLISKLLHTGEAVVINIGSDLFLVESYDVSTSVIKEKVYSNIKILDLDSGNELTLKKTFKSREIIHLRYNNPKIMRCIDEYYNEFSKLLNVSYLSYKSKNSRKWRLTYPGTTVQLKDPKTNEPISYEEYKSKITDGLLTEEEKIILLAEQFKLEELGSNSSQTSSDFTNLIKHWQDEVAQAFNIPLDIFHGSKTDKSTSTDDFITFAVSPLISTIEDEINSKLISMEDYLKGNKIVINKLNIKYVDIFDSATSLDKLFSNGFSHNDILGFLNLPKLDEKWANNHYVTKNYSNVENNGMSEGGDENGRRE